MKMYLTKYASSRGILEIEDIENSFSDPTDLYKYLNRILFYSYEEARQNALYRISEERKRLHKKLEKLEKLETKYKSM